ncbi:MAG: DsbA family protein [Gemmatimonadetes bacterium]|nr:DsbA family protein [Gemmatimonadota bacterium]MCC6770488.1 DsbA family protein [Gemmatimonadaceae bacterium]
MAKQSRDAGKGRGPNVVKKSAKGSQGRFYAILGLVAAALAVFIIYQVSKPKAPDSVAVDPSIPLPKAEGYLLGKADAPVQVIAFADFECPACGQFYVLTEPDVKQRLVETGEISYRFIDFPLPGHRNTWPASHAAACANEQGKFWPMHDMIFQGQDQWNGEATSRPKGVFEGYATSIGLDVPKWEQCYDEQRYLRNIQAHRAEAERRMVGSTPSFIIGNRLVAGSISFDKFKAYVDSAKAELPAPPAASAVPPAQD